MGYRGHDEWKDMSDFVVHFTRSCTQESRPTRTEAVGARLAKLRKEDRSGHYPWIDILGEGRLSRPGFRGGSDHSLRETQPGSSGVFGLERWRFLAAFCSASGIQVMSC